MIIIWVRNWWQRRKRMREAMLTLRELERVRGDRFWGG